MVGSGIRFRLPSALLRVFLDGERYYAANTAGTLPERLRQIHSFCRNRSPSEMLDTAAPWNSPWLPPAYEQNFWNAA
jgi:hypothetical protein